MASSIFPSMFSTISCMLLSSASNLLASCCNPSYKSCLTTMASAVSPTWFYRSIDMRSSSPIYATYSLSPVFSLSNSTCLLPIFASIYSALSCESSDSFSPANFSSNSFRLLSSLSTYLLICSIYYFNLVNTLSFICTFYSCTRTSLPSSFSCSSHFVLIATNSSAFDFFYSTSFSSSEISAFNWSIRVSCSSSVRRSCFSPLIHS